MTAAATMSLWLMGIGILGLLIWLFGLVYFAMAAMDKPDNLGKALVVSMLIMTMFVPLAIATIVLSAIIYGDLTKMIP